MNANKKSIAVACALLLLVSSARAHFTSILNIPPGPNLGDNVTVGSHTQVNLGPSGSIGNGFTAGIENVPSDDLEINVTGGTIGQNFVARSGSVVNIHGGAIGGVFRPWGAMVTITDGTIDRMEQLIGTTNISGGHIGDFYLRGQATISGGSFPLGITLVNDSEAQISGGIFGDSLEFIGPGSSIKLLGGEFRLDGLPVAGLDSVGNSVAINVPSNSILSGVLSDGTPFAFAENFPNGSLTLQAAAVAPMGILVINVPADPAPRGLRTGQALNLTSGGTIGPNFTAGWGSSVEITGGQVGENFEAIGAMVHIAGGEIGERADAFVGTTVEIDGGRVRDLFGWDQSTVLVSGGIIDRLRIAFGSSAEIAGGVLGNLQFFSGSQAELAGAEFRVNGVLVAGLNTAGDSIPFNIPVDAVLNGTLADGTPFAIDNFFGRLADGALTLKLANVAPPTSMHINVPTDAAPSGVRHGQVLTLNTGGQLPEHFTAVSGSMVNVLGGQVGRNAQLVDAQLNVEGGEIDEFLRLYPGATANVSGGHIAQNLKVIGATLSISGGEIADGWEATADSEINISGGIVGQPSGVNGVVNLRGGQFPSAWLNCGAEVEFNFYARQFFINGIDVTHLLTPNVPTGYLSLNTTGSNISGLLADGSPFTFLLGRGVPADRISLILSVPEPSSIVLAFVLVCGLSAASRFHMSGS